MIIAAWSDKIQTGSVLIVLDWLFVFNLLIYWRGESSTSLVLPRCLVTLPQIIGISDYNFVLSWAPQILITIELLTTPNLQTAQALLLFRMQLLSSVSCDGHEVSVIGMHCRWLYVIIMLKLLLLFSKIEWWVWLEVFTLRLQHLMFLKRKEGLSTTVSCPTALLACWACQVIDILPAPV